MTQFMTYDMDFSFFANKLREGTEVRMGKRNARRLIDFAMDLYPEMNIKTSEDGRKLILRNLKQV